MCKGGSSERTRRLPSEIDQELRPMNSEPWMRGLMRWRSRIVVHSVNLTLAKEPGDVGQVLGIG